jgi:hypothetical protein
MKVLVATKAKEFSVVLVDARIAFFGEIVTSTYQTRRPAVLKPPIAITERREQEHISIEIFGCAQQTHVLLTQGAEVVAYAAYVRSSPAVYRNCVRNPVHFELTDGKVADFDRMVNQFRVVVSRVTTESVLARVFRPHRGYNPPVAVRTIRGPLNVDFAGMILLTDDSGKHACAVEKGMGVVQVRTPNILFVGVDFSD